MYTIRPCSKCICQSCYDDFHRCRHKRTPTTMPKGVSEDDRRTSVYMDTFIEFPFRPPPTPFRPLHRNCLAMGKIETNPSTDYKDQYGVPKMPEEDIYRPKIQKHRPPTPEMEKQSVYMKDYSINLHPSFRKQILEKMDIWLADEEREKLKGTPLSFPKRPPRPYDYSKCEEELTGVVYIPRLLRKHTKRDDKVPVKLPNYHSDEAPSSYFGGSIAKMTYRAGLDHTHIPCCRPEQKYHPERLQECLDAQPEASGRPCPKYIYETPDRPVWANQDSFIGIKATFSNETTYKGDFPDHYATSIPHPKVGDRDYDPAKEPVIQLSPYLPMDPGFQKCAVQG